MPISSSILRVKLEVGKQKEKHPYYHPKKEVPSTPFHPSKIYITCHHPKLVAAPTFSDFHRYLWHKLFQSVTLKQVLDPTRGGYSSFRSFTTTHRYCKPGKVSCITTAAHGDQQRTHGQENVHLILLEEPLAADFKSEGISKSNAKKVIVLRDFMVASLGKSLRSLCFCLEIFRAQGQTNSEKNNINRNSAPIFFDST